MRPRRERHEPGGPPRPARRRRPGRPPARPGRRSRPNACSSSSDGSPTTTTSPGPVLITCCSPDGRRSTTPTGLPPVQHPAHPGEHGPQLGVPGRARPGGAPSRARRGARPRGARRTPPRCRTRRPCRPGTATRTAARRAAAAIISGQGVVRVAGGGPLDHRRQRRDHQPGRHPRLPLPDQQVGEQVAGVPAGAQGRPVRPDRVELVADRRRSSLAKVMTATLRAGARPDGRGHPAMIGAGQLELAGRVAAPTAADQHVVDPQQRGVHLPTELWRGRAVRAWRPPADRRRAAAGSRGRDRPGQVADDDHRQPLARRSGRSARPPSVLLGGRGLVVGPARSQGRGTCSA